jgi:hypothetical protein
MAIGLCRQIERRLMHEVVTAWGETPWRRNRRSYRRGQDRQASPRATTGPAGPGV